jgi:cell division protease FtsH
MFRNLTMICNRFIYFMLCSSATQAFVPHHVLYPSPQSSMIKRHSIEIDNDNPTFIAKTLHEQFFKYGIPQSYDGFMQQLKEKHIESVSLVTQNNQINGLITIDNLHKPHEYDMINAHLVQVVPAMSSSILQKLDEMNIRYDLFIQDNGSRNIALDFALNALQLVVGYLVIGLVIGTILNFFRGGSGPGTGGGGPGGPGGFGNPMRFMQSTFKEVNTNEVGVTFSDVAGCDEAKFELVEVVDFLKDPQKYADAGAKIPSGVLLEGPPGTGKTLLAQAVAGEAGVNYLYASGSQFIEMYVGVGASRVRDLFKRAKEQSPCVIFLDEVDAVGRQRGAGLAGGNDEREQTLNEILTNMDGFVKNEGIIVIAATNRADILDSALTRPGRFDRKVMVGLPDVEGRREIIDIHFKDKQVQNKTYLDDLAKLTSGFSGADIANLANEAAILSVRYNNTDITPDSIYKAFEKVTIGLPANKDNRPDKIVELVSAHEVGHALITHLFDDMFDLQRVTINANKNGAGGYTLFTPTEEYDNFPTKKFMLANLLIALGGRAAEQLFFETFVSFSDKYNNEVMFTNTPHLDITTGASNDLKQANTIARRYVSVFGMGRNIALYDGTSNAQPFLGRELATNGDKLSEYSKQEIDQEIEDLVQWAYQRSVEILKANKDDFFFLTRKLKENRDLYVDDFEEMDIRF